MNKEIDLILKLLTIMLLLISLIVAILSFNINKLGVISINNYSLVMPKAKENKKIKTNDLFITKKIGISQIKVNDEVVYIDIEDNKSIQKIGKVKSINITKTNTHIYNINNKRIDSSCIIGVYKYKIPFLAKKKRISINNSFTVIHNLYIQINLSFIKYKQKLTII